MPLVHMGDMLRHAHRHRYAVGAFDLVGLGFLEAIVAGAEACEAPVILSLAESHFEHYDFELAMAATVAAARRGRTREVVEMAHACGVPVEGELGYVAGVEGEDAEKHPGEVVYTAPEEAVEYVRRTGVDFLAVSIGTVHGRLRGEPRLDLDRLTAIDEALGMPLVIHGGTGLGDAQFRAIIERGVTKINYYTALADAAADSIRARAAADPRAGYTALTRDVRRAIREEVERCIRLWGSAGRAAEVLAEARPWREIEHVIMWNAEADAERAAAAMAEGREKLATIPGVRHVRTGVAVDDDARYRYCWLIGFASVAGAGTRRPCPTAEGGASTMSQAAPEALHETKLRSLPLLSRGKVRDIYAVGDDALLIVATDRISAFDVVLPTPIPGKGRVLTALSEFWFGRMAELVPGHLAELTLEEAVPDPAERALGTTSAPGRCAASACRRACGWPTGCRSPSTPPPPRPRPAPTTRTSISTARWTSSAASWPSACASSAWRSTAAPPNTPASGASSSPTPSSSSASTRRGPSI